MSDDTLAFIGGGNMARSLISGLLNSGINAEQIAVSDPIPDQRELLGELGVRVCADNGEAIQGADVVVLAVKPQVLGVVLKGLPVEPSQLLVSIAAGVPVAALRDWSHPDQLIVRCMPNTPALLGAGITALFAGEQVDAAGRDRAEAVLAAAGRTLWVDEEEKLDAVTAVSGSGPAYFFYLMESMIEAGVEQGLDVETATELTLETAYGAALMARERTSTPAELRANVTSPGGTTAAAIGSLDEADAGSTIRRALAAAGARSKSLAEEFGNT